MRQLLSNILGRQTKQTRSPRPQARPRLEALETRVLMAAKLSDDGFLLIDGTQANDWAWVSPVLENGVNYFRTFGYTGDTHVDLWVETWKVKGIVFQGWGGNDDFAHTTTLPCWMLGGDGNDKLTGGYGVDVLYGQAGNDYLSDQTQTATAGWDNWFYGGTGDDNVNGANGNDQLTGGAGNDVVNGGNGFDYLAGKEGNDQLNGGWGDDQVYGGMGDDTVTGFQGNDWVWGGSGADTLYGDAGKDYIQYDPADVKTDFSVSDGDQWWS